MSVETQAVVAIAVMIVAAVLVTLIWTAWSNERAISRLKRRIDRLEAEGREVR